MVMFGGRHIEIAALKMLGDWLEVSSSVNALVQVQVMSYNSSICTLVGNLEKFFQHKN